VRVLFATTNRGKLAELRAMAPAGIEVVSLSEVPLPPVDEDAETFEGNARKKAIESARGSGLPAVADDSGLCVDALGGRPGVHSARYVQGSDEDRVGALLAETAAVPDPERGAAFKCVLSLALPSGKTWEVEGEVRGRLARAPRGNNGFGYDPIFLVDDHRTMAELAPAEKSTLSHRGRAFQKLKPLLSRLAEGALGGEGG
jgi:XTP/dITP diphosphohydrolase